MTVSHALPILAVLGPSRSRPELDRVAEEVGSEAAQAGWVVLTGGGPGVMEAACRGAVGAGGLTVGVLPVARASGGYPNPWVRIPVFTGAGSARNAFNVLSARLCVAIGGGPGTLSEIALALKAHVPVLAWSSWELTPPDGVSTDGLETVMTPDALLARLRERLHGIDGSR
jgi:uncharacterized protein (TIGR00725 family)